MTADVTYIAVKRAALKKKIDKTQLIYTVQNQTICYIKADKYNVPHPLFHLSEKENKREDNINVNSAGYHETENKIQANMRFL